MLPVVQVPASARELRSEWLVPVAQEWARSPVPELLLETLVVGTASQRVQVLEQEDSLPGLWSPLAPLMAWASAEGL